MVLASVAMAGGHTDKIPEVAEQDIQQIIHLPPRLAVAGWMALSPNQREEMIHYSTTGERGLILDYFEFIITIDGLRR
jgi:hypothetical protein